MHTGDLRRAGVELRRAVDEAPRDLAAVGALAQLLDRARDQAGRRAVLDRAVGLLRHDLGAAGRTSWRRCGGWPACWRCASGPHAALAAAQLVAALGAGAQGGRAGRRAAGAEPRGAPPPRGRRARLPVRSCRPGYASSCASWVRCSARAARELAQRLGSTASRAPTGARAARRRDRCSTPSRPSWASATSISTSRRRPRRPGPSRSAPSRATRPR